MEQEELIIDDFKVETDSSDQDAELTEQESQTDECSASVATQTQDSDAKSEEESEEVMEGPDETECAATPERRRNKQYFCCVLGCRNTRSPDQPPEQRLSMFSVPSEPTRKRKWLRMIDREDLINSTSTQHVCEAHFYPGSIIPTTTRKLLKKNAIPILNLPLSGSKQADLVDSGSQVWVYVAHKHSQAVPSTASRHTQTTADLQMHLPAVQKLKLQLKQLNATRRKFDSKKHEIALLHELCDKYMSDQFATLAKVHLRNKKHSQGNRYDDDFKKFCLRLHDASSKAYDILSEVLPLPCKSNLKILRASKDSGSSSQTKLNEVPMNEQEPWQDEMLRMSDAVEAGPSGCDSTAPHKSAVMEGVPAVMEGAPAVMEGIPAVMEGSPAVMEEDQETQTGDYEQLLAQPMPLIFYSKHNIYK